MAWRGAGVLVALSLVLGVSSCLVSCSVEELSQVDRLAGSDLPSAQAVDLVTDTDARRSLLQDAADAAGGSAGGEASAEGGDGGGDNPRRSNKNVVVHGWLAASGLGILLPLAMVLSGTMRDLPHSVWFNAHRLVALVGYLVGVAAIGMGLYMRPMQGAKEEAHQALGLIALGLGFLQILAIVLRPNPEHKLRSAWNHYHHWTGRLLVAVVIANVYLGINMADAGTNWYIVYTAILGAILLFALLKTILNLGRPSRTRTGLAKKEYIIRKDGDLPHGAAYPAAGAANGGVTAHPGSKVFPTNGGGGGHVANLRQVNPV